ncbi:MAG TPA: hypothetical protein VM409_08545 [Chloroflexia bacterium]|nr:hypothetical protein [Chloroflexia bacterium]
MQLSTTVLPRARHDTVPTSTSATPTRTLLVGGALLLVCSVGLFLLLQSRSLWESPSLMPDRWKALYKPLRSLFPPEWIMARKWTSLGLLNAALFMVIVALLFFVYLKVVTSLFTKAGTTRLRGRVALAIITGVATIALVLFFFSPGFLSTDLYSYISYGRIAAIYDDNPFFRVPADYAWYDKANWLQWVVWRETPSAYGPVWLDLASLLALAARAIDGDIVTHLLAHKLAAGVAYLLNILLLWKVAGLVVARYWQRPEAIAVEDEKAWQTGIKTAITATFAWNPLVIIEFGISAHNDVFMLTAILAALWLHLLGHWRWAVGAFALAAMVKVSALFFFPGYLWLLAWESKPKSRGKLAGAAGRLAQAGMIFLAVCATGYWRYWEGLPTLKHLSGGPPATLFIHSLGAIVRFKVPDAIELLSGLWGSKYGHFWTSEEIGARLEWPARWGLLLISVTAACVRTWRARTFPTMVNAWGWVLLIYLTIGSVWFWPWYVTWLLVPVALVGPGRLFTATQVLCVSSMTIYALSPRVAKPLDALPGWTGLFVVAPPLIYLAVDVWRQRQRTSATMGNPTRSPAREVAARPHVQRVGRVQGQSAD